MIFYIVLLGIILCFNYLTFFFLKSLNEDPTYSDLTIKKLTATSIFPPLGIIITIILISFGFILIIIETINNRIKN